jgi:2,4-dienoyl-CoA reductase-like NADH-dependent reductase (Old Yellow Enzyme family)
MLCKRCRCGSFNLSGSLSILVSLLFNPFNHGCLELPNRLALAPMTTYASQSDGTISDDELPYLERRALGGLGMIITAACYVHPSGHAFLGQWGCHEDAMIPSLSRTAEVIHRGGGKAYLQIHHGGRMCNPTLTENQETISASAVAYPQEGARIPREMTTSEIERTLSDFANAASRAKQAGFDGVEIHGANTYLLQQFVSPQSNLRTDRWNADGLRFPVELTQRVLKAVGDEFPVGYRFSPEEGFDNGITLERTLALLDELIQLNVSYLHLSLREYNQPSLRNSDSEPVLKTIANHINGRTPLIGVGSIKTMQDAEAAMKLGADLVAVGRVAVSEPEFAKKLRTGDQVRTKLPKGDFDEALSIPKGLGTKIRNTPGWFETED